MKPRREHQPGRSSYVAWCCVDVAAASRIRFLWAIPTSLPTSTGAIHPSVWNLDALLRDVRLLCVCARGQRRLTDRSWIKETARSTSVLHGTAEVCAHAYAHARGSTDRPALISWSGHEGVLRREEVRSYGFIALIRSPCLRAAPQVCRVPLSDDTVEARLASRLAMRTSRAGPGGPWLLSLSA